ncbi:MAG: hypothetical protein Q4G16_11745 [Cruoricaptor ignavus]|nr:hypothetical protein [Cruoricaptor ignavus]
MKYTILLAVGLAVLSCKKNETQSANETQSHDTEHTEESMVQDAKSLKNSDGETISITYFAQGDEVAVKLKIGNEEQRTLSAKGTSSSGNPIFSDGTYAWEMSEDGQGGILSDGKTRGVSYR